VLISIQAQLAELQQKPAFGESGVIEDVVANLVLRLCEQAASADNDDTWRYS
jgi:hypothetical protein